MPEASRRLRELVVGALEELKAQDLVVLDVRPLTTITDLMVIASGTSTRHVKALADRVLERAREAGVRPLSVEGEREAEWILVDLGDLVLHVMLPETRAFYELEKLWGLAEEAPPRRAGA
ncbi:MAG: ribosome silencing factor [Gammaproteobacteria bacterium]|nr:MAG: ribosome silencing factor [Gammaproteobacteria bacterium]